jgi:hypothetical protein
MVARCTSAGSRNIKPTAITPSNVRSKKRGVLDCFTGEMRTREPAAKRRCQSWRSVYSIDHESFVVQRLRNRHAGAAAEVEDRPTSGERSSPRSDHCNADARLLTQPYELMAAASWPFDA